MRSQFSGSHVRQNVGRLSRIPTFWRTWLLLCVLATSASAAERPPNFLVILMDDMGWQDVGFMGNRFVETPHLDRLAKGGLIFTQAYASAPNCAPTRACLMSGQYTPRHGIYTVVDPRQPPGSPWHKLTAADSQSELDTNIVTVAEALQSGGYATGFFGMWNLGRGRTGPVTPGGQGFQTVVFPENLGFGKDEYFDDEMNYLSDRLTDEVISFVEKNRDQPFFAYLPDHAVHAPYNPKPDLLAKYQKKLGTVNTKAAGNRPRSGERGYEEDPAYAATIEAVDQNVGRLMETLAKLKLVDNTVVFFMSDNGGTQQYTAPLRGGKGELYEGGIRVPMMVSWPGLKKSGSQFTEPVASIDLYPTLLDLAVLPAPRNQIQDGVSLVPVLRGEKQLLRERLFWHFPCYVGKATPCSAVREGNYKLIEFFEDGGHLELYDLQADPNEAHDLSKVLPNKTKAMARTLKEWQTQTRAALPQGPNPAFDPQADRPRGGPPGGRPPGRQTRK